jgi:hypothetical protein
MGILNFADLRSRGNDIEKLNEEANKFKQTSFAKDERYWEPELDKAGEGSAILRFMPAPAGEDVPFVRLYSYGFKAGSKWFIENSPATIGLPCPIMEYNSSLWDSGSEENKEIARNQKRRLSFITNVQVVRHKARPSDEGKVFLYRFGKKIWDKLSDKMNPEDEDTRPMNPFDLWNGANFRLKIAQVSGFRNYDKSEFDIPGPLSNDDAYLEQIWKQTYSLKAEVGPDKFKSYNELKEKLEKTLNLRGQAVAQAQRDDDNSGSNRSDNEPPFDMDKAGDDENAWLRELAQK